MTIFYCGVTDCKYYELYSIKRSAEDGHCAREETQISKQRGIPICEGYEPKEINHD